MESINSYIKKWESEYKTRLDGIKLFNPSEIKSMSGSQRKYFAELFWHARGHFSDFLWILGSKAPDLESKLIIIDNITHEFGARKSSDVSHELLYTRYASSLGADTSNYPIDSTNYPEFLKKYNKKHLQFLLDKDWDICSSAFSAYERLDNFDYVALEDIGKGWGLNTHDLEFCEVHSKGEHFDEVSNNLAKIWDKDPNLVKLGFEFIGNHQLQMWEDLSNEVLK